ncbi:hypothetical protein HXZ88_04070 [Myroides odoratimimus]|uniref:hypothetical protein n=1 Tax=Myroides TaxID=76831 RepID=UPI00131C1C18|nr:MULTISPECIES: hypothetical protein [Myroides]MDM1064795.1 hypothetical protein [Myroides odoratimimus]MDM1400900.1 hypothetical protein [Myroides odoratimimus]MDM1443301.1 hypothetical protein [Myroides odoratimimus]
MYKNLDELIEKYKSITSNNSHLTNNIQEIIQRGITFQYDENETDANLLFLGMNPSFGGDVIDGIFPWTKEFSKDLNYFKPFFSIEEQLKNEYQIDLKWTHFDLFVFRETKQARIENIFMSNEEGRVFLFQQLEVLKERLLRTKPKVIVASNALIRTFLGMNRHHDKNGNEVGVWLGDWIKFEFDKTIGTHVISEPIELKGTKIFFTSMLSGQRALDLGTRERLVWHIAEVLK